MPPVIAISLIGILVSFGVVITAFIVSTFYPKAKEKAGTVALYAWATSLAFCGALLLTLVFELFAQLL